MEIGKMVVVGTGVLVAVAVRAGAVPRESVTFTNVRSQGEQNSADNEIRTQTFTGTYTVRKVHASGTVTSHDPATYITDLRVALRAGASQQVVIQFFAAGDVFTTVTLPDTVYTLAVPVSSAAAEWSFRFFETVADAPLGEDALWTTVTFTLDDDVTQPPPSDYPEVEPNDNKGQATPVVGITDGQTIGGNSTGATTTPGLTSIDYFRVKTGAASPGIYRHRLTLTSNTPGHLGSLRGLSQSQGQIDASSDVSVQSSTAQTTPPRFNQWYGFGKQEEVYYAVSGTANTTQAYLATHTVTAVAPIDAGAALTPGLVTFSTQGTTGGTQTDTDLWLYDGTYTAMPGAGNDDWTSLDSSSRLTISGLGTGTYYLAIADYNLANNLASPVSGEMFANGSVLDFPNAVAASSAASNVNVGVRITDSAGTRVVPAVREGPFDVVFITVTVAPSHCPADLDDGSGTGTPDGGVTIDDLIYFVAAFEVGAIQADLDDGSGLGHPDGGVTIDDLLFFVQHFSDGC